MPSIHPWRPPCFFFYADTSRKLRCVVYISNIEIVHIDKFFLFWSVSHRTRSFVYRYRIEPDCDSDIRCPMSNASQRLAYQRTVAPDVSPPHYCERWGWGGRRGCTQAGGGGEFTHVMHGRNRVTVDPRIPTMPGWNTSGFRRPGTHCSHQAQSAVGWS